MIWISLPDFPAQFAELGHGQGHTVENAIFCYLDISFICLMYHKLGQGHSKVNLQVLTFYWQVGGNLS